ncbi:MAG: autotransporter-associated beta strand repeat-containing protein [Akkermansiaceae bacterium]
MKRLLLPLLLAFSTSNLFAQIPAFPGAQGYGAFATGGRGGDVYTVTNLNSTGAGSLYNGLTTIPANGRTIVFAVSGQIHLAGGIATRITQNKLTIAGQTAPGDGVMLRNGTLRISADDIIIRHLRFRHGKNGSGGDCIDLDSGCQNAILDHISMAFSTDENISSFGSPPENLTMQWSFNAWGLESHSAGGLWDQNHATCHHSLWAHNHTRNPKARPNGLLEWANNVTFDWDIGFIMGDSATPANWKANVIGNYFVCPPGNIISKPLIGANLDRNGYPNFSVHVANNLHDNNGDGILNGTDRGWNIVNGSAYHATNNPTGNYLRLDTPVSGSSTLTVESPLLAHKKIVSHGGALRTDIGYSGTYRDEVDSRLIQNLTTQTRNHITRESDLTGISNAGFGTFNASAAPVDSDKDGMPDFYETALGWNPSTQDHNTELANSGGLVTGTNFFPSATPAGYTRLEEYLHYLSIPHGTVPRNIAGSPTHVQIDLSKFTAGFSDAPLFTVSNIVGGTIVQSGVGNRIVTFTPTLNLTGRARFDFSVTDSAGHSFTQTCGLVVTSTGLPRDISWKGLGNTWDTNTATNWLQTSNNTTVAYSDGDRVTFDQSGIAQANVSIVGDLVPTLVDVNATGNYTFGGTGSVNSSGALTKRGSGTLNLATAQNYLSGTTVEAGTLTINNPGSLSGGSVTLWDGTTLTNGYPTGTSSTQNAGIHVPVGNSATINSGNRFALAGPLTGAGTLNCNVQTTVTRFDIKGTTAAYTGRINFINAGGVRLFYVGGTFNGFDNTWLDVGGSVSLQPQTNSGGNTCNISTLSGNSNTANLAGGSAGAVAYVVGAGNNSTTFAGSITGNATFTKNGSGTLILAGTNTFSGATTLATGGLLIDGSLGSSVTVSNGAMLGGDGNISGNVTANAGAILSPGTTPFTGATLTIGGGLTLQSNTIYCDLSHSPTGANDKIVVGGTLGLTGAQYFQFLLLNGSLAAGTYDLISANNSTASGVTLAHNLPNDSRQTFALARSAAGSNPSKVWLTVSGNPTTLTWTGTTSNSWDTTTTNNWSGASPNTFYNNDDVLLNDTALTRAVTITGTLAPRTAEINTSLGYTFSGTGSIGGTASLTKNGTGTLTLSNTTANTFSGGITLNAGNINLSNDTLNANGLGTGPVTMNGGVISMFDNMSSYNNFTAQLIVPNGATARINADSRVDIYGSLAGGGTLQFYVPNVRSTLFANWSVFTGNLNVLTDANGGDFRMGNPYSYPGFPQALVNLSDRIWAYYDGTLAEGAGTTIPIGALSGTSLSTLQGGSTGGRALTYRIGGKNTDALFAGTISERNTGTATNYIKTGTGVWTLSGTGNWNGGTSIEQGTLKITGTSACAGATQMSSGSVLRIEAGSLTTESVNLVNGSTLAGWGNLTADLNAEGVIEGRGFASGTAGTLNIQGSVFLGSTSVTRMRAGITTDLINVSGDLALDGTMLINLSPGTTFGRYRLISCSGIISGSLALSGIPIGTTAQLSTSTNAIDLVINDSDEDGLPDTWEIMHFGNLSKTALQDSDGDGTSNLAEYRLNLLPNNGSQFFKAGIIRNPNSYTITWPSAAGVVFTVQRSTNLIDWITMATVTGIGTYTDTNPPIGKSLYRVSFIP